MPRPPNRFQEIMDKPPKVEAPGSAVRREKGPLDFSAASNFGARDFMSRRGAQLDQEKLKAKADERAKGDARFGAKSEELRAANSKAAALAQRLRSPRPADAEVAAEQGLQLRAPVPNLGKVSQYSSKLDLSLFTDAVTGVTKVRRGSKVVEFGSRREALEALQKGDPFAPR